MAIDQDTLLRTLLAERAKVIGYIRAIVRQRELAEDVFQDVCLLALEKREQILDHKHLLGWLRTSSRLRAMNVLRKRQNRQRSLDDSVLEQIEGHWSAHDTTSGSAMAEALRECRERLTDKAKALLDRRYGDGLSVADIARNVNRPVNSMYVTLSRIHATLADCVFRRVSAGGRSS